MSIRSRDRVLRQIAGALALVTGDGAESSTAQRVADRLRARHGVDDAELDEFLARKAEDESLAVTMPAEWATPARIAILALVADATGTRCGAKVEDGALRIRFEGHGAGRARRKAEAVLARAEARVASLGEVKIRALPHRRALGMPGFFGTMATTTTATNGWVTMSIGPRTLGDAFGASAPDVFRVACVHAMLAGEIAERRADAMRERFRNLREASVAPPSPVPPRQDDAPGPTPTPASAPPPVSPADPAEADATRDLAATMAAAQRFMATIRDVVASSPAWAEPEPPPPAAMEVARCAAP